MTFANAAFSGDRLYRYTLWRGCDDSLYGPKEYVNFICLNPSTADETKDDPTIRKCIKFARSWGYEGRICVTNLFAYRSTDRKQIRKVADPVGPDNDWYIEQVAANAGMVIAAWSQDGSYLNRSAQVRELLGTMSLHYLKMSAEPHHPLYLPDNTQPTKWHLMK